MLGLDLEAAVVSAVALLGALALLPALRAGLRPLGRGGSAARRRLVRLGGRVRDAGALVVARRAAAGLLGSASAVLAVTAPARAAVPDRATVAPAAPALEPAGTRFVPRVVPAAAAEAATVVVRRGDTLWHLARRHLPAGATDAQIARAWPLWYAANRAVIGPDPGLLLPGQRLRVPGARPTGTSSTPHHRSPVRASGPTTTTPATSLDPDRR